MNTTRPTPAAAVHESVRTAVSTNRDPETGMRTQVLTTSRLTLAWEAGELKVRCVASRVTLNASHVQRAVRRARM